MGCEVKEGPSNTLKPVRFRIFAALSALSGLAALFFTFAEKSESKSAWLAGYSAMRWLLGLLTTGLLAVCVLILIRDLRSGGAAGQRIHAFLVTGDRAWFTFWGMLLLLYGSLWAFKFSWLFIPANLRPQILWLAFVSLCGALILWVSYRERFRADRLREKYRLFPRLQDLNARQKQTLAVLLVLGLIYILVLLPSNLNGTKDWDAFRHYGGDEYVIYPILQNVLTPGKDFSATLYHHYIHEDYHYGYPFYAVSSVFFVNRCACHRVVFMVR